MNVVVVLVLGVVVVSTTAFSCEQNLMKIAFVFDDKCNQRNDRTNEPSHQPTNQLTSLRINDPLNQKSRPCTIFPG